MDQRPIPPRDGEEEMDELNGEMYSVASYTECTGLMPTPPISEPEVDSYNDLYDIPLAADPEAANHHLQNFDNPED